MVPGSATPLKPEGPLAALNPRLSESEVCVGTIQYPEGPNPQTGLLVVAKATLTPRDPYELWSYALENPAFPHDSTADQWFDFGQFERTSALERSSSNGPSKERRQTLLPPGQIGRHRTKSP